MTKTTGITPETEAMMVELLPAVSSLRELAAMLGLGQRLVAKLARPHLDAMTAAGTHPICGCGKPRFHRWGCSINREKASPALRKSLAIQHGERREFIVALIKQNLPYRRIAEIAGVDRSCIRGYMKWLTPEEREARIKFNATQAGHGWRRAA